MSIQNIIEEAVITCNGEDLFGHSPCEREAYNEGVEHATEGIISHLSSAPHEDMTAIVSEWLQSADVIDRREFLAQLHELPQ